MELKTVHYVLIAIVAIVFILLLVLVTWLLMIVCRKRKQRKKMGQYPLALISEIDNASTSGTGVADVTSQSSGGENFAFPTSIKEILKGRFPNMKGHMGEDDDDYDEDDSGHGTSVDYENIRIDVIETNTDGAYARPQKSTLKKDKSSSELRADKKVNFSEDIETVIDGETKPDQATTGTL